MPENRKPSVVDEKLRRIDEIALQFLLILFQDGGVWSGKRLLQRGEHMAEPDVACPLIDDERRMAQPQTRMSSLLVVRSWTAEVLHEKEAKSSFRGFKVVGVHRAQYRIRCNATVETSNQPLKEFLPAKSIKL